eukprot:284817326_3
MLLGSSEIVFANTSLQVRTPSLTFMRRVVGKIPVWIRAINWSQRTKVSGRITNCPYQSEYHGLKLSRNSVNLSHGEFALTLEHQKERRKKEKVNKHFSFHRSKPLRPEHPNRLNKTWGPLALMICLFFLLQCCSPMTQHTQPPLSAGQLKPSDLVKRIPKYAQIICLRWVVSAHIWLKRPKGKTDMLLTRLMYHQTGGIDMLNVRSDFVWIFTRRGTCARTLLVRALNFCVNSKNRNGTKERSSVFAQNGRKKIVQFRKLPAEPTSKNP